MKKIGIFTLYHNNYNYGSTLQAYALSKFITDLGYDAKVICYSGHNNVVYKSITEKLIQYNKTEVVRKVLDIVIGKVNNKKIQYIITERRKLFDDFCSKYIPHTDVINDNALVEIDEDFDFFISGSDQVWNPNCAFLAFLLGFISNGYKKISYAASISRDDLTEHELEVMLPYINNFKAISVREETARDILTRNGVNKVSVLIDPTFLLAKSTWESLTVAKTIGRKYAFCYFFSDSIKYRSKVAEFCESQSIDLIYLPYAKQSYNKTDGKGKGIKLDKVGPLEFISLIKNAEYVFTDSFHGTALSIIFEKDFWVLERDSNEVGTSKNSRIYDLLRKFRLDGRLLKKIDDIEPTLLDRISYEEIRHIIENEIRKSQIFLINAFQ